MVYSSCRRSAPRQHPVGRGLHSSRFREVAPDIAAPAVGGDLHNDAVQAGKTVSLDDFLNTFDGNRDFISHSTMNAHTARFELFQQLQAVPNGNASRWRLLTALPDTDGTGEPITDSCFERRWWNHEDLLKHLFKKHEGELAELWGEWVEFDRNLSTDVFDKLSHAQFAKSSNEWSMRTTGDRYTDFQAAAVGKGKAVKGDGKAATVGKGTAVKGDGKPAAGGKGTAVKGDGKPAAGGKGKGTEGSRVLSSHDGEWMYRRATVISLPELFLKLGEHRSAAELYQYWHTRPLLTVKRPHSWAQPHRRAAAQIRFHETGYYGVGSY